MCPSVSSPIFLNFSQAGQPSGWNPSLSASLECIWPKRAVAGGGRRRWAVAALRESRGAALGASARPDRPVGARSPPGPAGCAGLDRGAQFCAAARRGRACQVGAGLPGPAPLRPALVCPLQSVSAPQPTPLRPWLTPGRRAVHTAVLFLFSVGSVSPQPPTGPLSLWRREAGFRSCGGSLRSGRRAPSPAGGGPCALPERSAVSHGPAVKQCLRQRGNLCRNAGPSVVFSPGRPPFGPCRCVCGGTVGRLRHENAPGWFRPGLEPLSREDAVCFPGWPSRRGLIHGTHARLTSTVFFKGKKKKKRRRLWALLKQLQRRRVGGGGVRRRFVS